MLIRLREEIANKRATLCRTYEGLKVESVLDIDGNLLYTSDSRKELLGYGPEDSVNECILKYVHPDDIKNAKQALAHMVRTHEKHLYGFRMKHKSGHWIPIHVHGAPLMENGEVQGFVVVFHERIDLEDWLEDQKLKELIAKHLNKQKRTG